MKSSMRIIRKLPPAPRPTRDYRNPYLDAFGNRISMPSPVKGFSDEKIRERVKECCEKRKKTAAEKQAIVVKMALEGKTDKEMMEATGYAKDSVRRIINMKRNEGLDIPARKKGRKKQCRN